MGRMRSAGSPAARRAWSLSWSILPDRRPSLGRGVPLAGISDLPREVNSRGSSKKSEAKDWLEFYADGELAGVDLAIVPFNEAKAIYSHSARTDPSVISQSIPRSVRKPALKALVLPVPRVGSP